MMYSTTRQHVSHLEVQSGHQTTPVDINAQWREVWTSAPVVNQSLVPDPTIRQPGFDLPRHTWSVLNRFRAGRGTYHADLHQWGLSPSESCSCGQKQTMSDILDSCPLSRFEGGLQQLHTADDRAVHWLETAAKEALAKWKTFLVPAHLGRPTPGKRAVKQVCVCVVLIYSL